MGAVIADRQARLLAKLAEPDAALSELVQRMCDGEGFYEVCRAWDVPSGRVMEWLLADIGRFDKYQMALRVQREILAERAVAGADESVAIADGVDEDKVAIAKAGLRVRVRKDLAELRVGLAGVMAPERYARRAVADAGVTVNADAGLIGLASDLLRLVASGGVALGGAPAGERVVAGAVIDNDEVVL